MSDANEFGTVGDHGEVEPIEGKYIWVEYEDETYRIYYETAGDGETPLLCLHTAGADSRQWRHVLGDPTIREDFTIFAFDLPWHGRSFPPMNADAEWRDARYRLTTEMYAGLIVRVAETLELDDPVAMGCSMGGAIVLELAFSHADTFRSVIGLESTAFAPKRDIGYLDSPSVNAEVVRAEWADGLQAPQSPDRFTRESWWVYSQGAPGVYTGDLHFYATDWDGREKVSDIDTDRCGVFLLTGEYDYSALPSDTEFVGERIDGCHIEIMPEMGHFPMVENPSHFRTYVLPVLDAAREP